MFRIGVTTSDGEISSLMYSDCGCAAEKRFQAMYVDSDLCVWPIFVVCVLKVQRHDFLQNQIDHEEKVFLFKANPKFRSKCGVTLCGTKKPCFRFVACLSSYPITVSSLMMW